MPPAQWIPLFPASAPSTRGAVGFASSTELNESLLYGGADINQLVGNDTWTYANGSWTNLSATLAVSPPPLAGEGMTYDAADGYFVLIGGLTGYGGTPVAQTWSFANSSWTNQTSASAPTPSARYGEAMVYDPATGYVLLFGGWTTSSALSDTWKYLHGTWTDLTSVAGTPPSARAWAGATYDARLHAVILWGGAALGSTAVYNDTWEYAVSGGGATWINITAAAGNAPPARRMAALTYDPAYGYDLLFGGDPCAPYGCAGGYSDVWAFENDSWRDLTPSMTITPPGRFEGGMVYDPTAGALVLFGGCTAVGCTSGVNDTWRYSWNLSASLGSSSKVVGVNGTFTLTTTAAGGSFGYDYNYSGLPAGCPSSNTSSLTCRPTSTGNFTPSVLVTDAWDPTGPASAVNASGPHIEVVAPLALAVAVSRSLLDALTPTWLNLTVGGGVGGYSYSFSGLPAGCASANVSQLKCVPSSGGTSTVQVTLRDARSESTSVDVTLQVDPPVSVVGTASRAIVEVGQPVEFNATAGGGNGAYAYGWQSSGPGCATSDGSSLQCTPTSPGLLNVTVVVNDSLGGHASHAFAAVDTLVGPSATVTATPLAGTPPLSVDFTVNVAGGLGPFQGTWQFGDGAIADSGNATHTYQSSGTFVAKLWVNDSLGGSTGATVVVVVGAAPTVALNATPTSAEVGQPLTLTATISGGVAPFTYSWSRLPTGCSGGNVSIVDCTPSAPGTFSVIVSVTDGQGSSIRQTDSVVVAPSLTVTFSYAPTAGSSCPATETVNFTAAPSGGVAPFTYAWTFGDGQGSDLASPTHVYSTTPSSDASLTVTDAGGARVQDNASVALQLSYVACGGVSPSSSGGSLPWIVVALVIVAAVAAIGAILLIRRRSRPPAVAPESASSGEPRPEPSENTAEEPAPLGPDAP